MTQRTSNVFDDWQNWVNTMYKNRGVLLRGGDSDLEQFARETGHAGKSLQMLRKKLMTSSRRKQAMYEEAQPCPACGQSGYGYHHGRCPIDPGGKLPGPYNLDDMRMGEGDYHHYNSLGKWPEYQKWVDIHRGAEEFRREHPEWKMSNRKQAWMGWGPSQTFVKHKVANWDWDDHLNGYITTSAKKFACDCGEEMHVPSYHNCKCGKIWNSYVIGTGGDNHQASVEKFICREIPVRENVIVATKRHNLTDPGEVEDGEEVDEPTMAQPPKDWHHRGRDGRWV